MPSRPSRPWSATRAASRATSVTALVVRSSCSPVVASCWLRPPMRCSSLLVLPPRRLPPLLPWPPVAKKNSRLPHQHQHQLPLLLPHQHLTLQLPLPLPPPPLPLRHLLPLPASKLQPTKE